MNEDQTISVLRAIVTSRKHTNENDIRNGFREIEGCEVPYRKFGYNRLDEFLQASGEFIIISSNGGTQIKAKLSKDAAHISQLVAGQKCATRKRPKSLPQRRPFGMSAPRNSAYSNSYNNRQRFVPKPNNRMIPPKDFRNDKPSSAPFQMQNNNNSYLYRSTSYSAAPPNNRSVRTFASDVSSTSQKYGGQLRKVETTELPRRKSPESNVAFVRTFSSEFNSTSAGQSSSKDEKELPVKKSAPISSSEQSKPVQQSSVPQQPKMLQIYKPATLRQKTVPLQAMFNDPVTKPITNGHQTQSTTMPPNTQDKTSLLNRRLEQCQRVPILEKPVTNEVNPSLHTDNKQERHQKSKLGDRLLRIQQVAVQNQQLNGNAISKNETKLSDLSPTSTLSPDVALSPIIGFEKPSEPLLDIITHNDSDDFATKLTNYAIEKTKSLPEYRFFKISNKNVRFCCKIMVRIKDMIIIFNFDLRIVDLIVYFKRVASSEATFIPNVNTRILNS